MVKYTYRLKRQIEGLDLRYYKKEIKQVLKTLNAFKTVVYARGFSFCVSNELADGKKRCMGKELAKIPGIGEFAIKYEYTYEDGRPGKSNQIFELVEEIWL